MIIQWDPHKGKYLHHCNECNELFHGRKNQLFCGLKCKAKHNNELAAERRSKERELVDDYLRNVEILGSLIPEYSYDVEIISIEKLETLGFKAESANKRIMQNGEIWYQLGPYAYRTVERLNKVELLRLE